MSVSGSRPPASRTKLNFAGKGRRETSPARRPSSAARLSARSSAAAGSRSLNGLATMLRSRSTSGSASMRPAAPRRACRSGRDSSLRPRICRFPRADSAIEPLPQASAASAIATAWPSVRRPPDARTRASSPSPVSIGLRAPGHQPLRRGAIGLMRPPSAGKREYSCTNCDASAKSRAARPPRTREPCGARLAGWPRRERFERPRRRASRRT